MAKFTLDDLQAEVDKKYAPTVIEAGDKEFVLPNALQLPEKQQAEVFDLIDANDEADDDIRLDTVVDSFKKVIRIVTKDGKGDELLELVGDNSAAILELMSHWQEGTQLGEAEKSAG